MDLILALRWFKIPQNISRDVCEPLLNFLHKITHLFLLMKKKRKKACASEKTIGRVRISFTQPVSKYLMSTYYVPGTEDAEIKD